MPEKRFIPGTGAQLNRNRFAGTTTLGVEIQDWRGVSLTAWSKMCRIYQAESMDILRHEHNHCDNIKLCFASENFLSQGIFRLPRKGRTEAWSIIQRSMCQVARRKSSPLSGCLEGGKLEKGGAESIWRGNQLLAGDRLPALRMGKARSGIDMHVRRDLLGIYRKQFGAAWMKART